MCFFYPPAFVSSWWVHSVVCRARFPFLFCFIDCLSQSCPLFISTSEHQADMCVLYCLSVTSTFSLVAVPILTSSSSPPSYSLYPFSIVLLPHTYWLHSSILVQPPCSPSPLPSSLSRSIILASHSEQKQHQSNWFCRCAEEPHQLTDWVSRLPSPSGPPYFFLSLLLLLPLFSLVPVSSLLAFCLSSVPFVAVFLSQIPRFYLCIPTVICQPQQRQKTSAASWSW